MLSLKLLLLPIFAIALAGAGCQTKTSVVDGSGFSALHPSTETRKFVVKNDLEFAKEIAAHNEVCAAQAGCRK